MSFGCSAHESPKVDYQFRPLSKICFALIFIPSVAFLAHATTTKPHPIQIPTIYKFWVDKGSSLSTQTSVPQESTGFKLVNM